MGYELRRVDTFVETVIRYNEMREKGKGEDFGKPPEYLAKVDTPPFYGIHRWVRMSAICSGVDVNADHQCLTPEGEVIEGLYAIGNCWRLLRRHRLPADGVRPFPWPLLHRRLCHRPYGG